MAIFDKNIINIEGGLTNDPHDKGGLTKYGISKRDYQNLDIINLTVDQAIQIYQTDYWNKCRLDNVNNQTLADIIFILAVNVGVVEAVKIVQRAILHCFEMSSPLKIDGICGSVTIHYINLCESAWLLDALRIEECQYYLSIVDHDCTQEIFLRGW